MGTVTVVAAVVGCLSIGFLMYAVFKPDHALEPVSTEDLPECEYHPDDLTRCNFYRLHPRKGETVYIGCAKNDDWINVYAPFNGSYTRYGYSVDGDRWAHGQRPQSSSIIAHYAVMASILAPQVK